MLTAIRIDSTSRIPPGAPEALLQLGTGMQSVPGGGSDSWHRDVGATVLLSGGNGDHPPLTAMVPKSPGEHPKVAVGSQEALPAEGRENLPLSGTHRSSDTPAQQSIIIVIAVPPQVWWSLAPSLLPLDFDLWILMDFDSPESPYIVYLQRASPYSKHLFSWHQTGLCLCPGAARDP